MQRKANAVWRGSGKDGTGSLDTGSGAIKGLPYTYKMRFEDEEGRSGTNPEELIAAAHAGCFAMQLAFVLQNAGHPAEEINTASDLTFSPIDGKPTISKIHLTVSVRAPGLGTEEIRKHVDEAKRICPVSRVLNAEITAEVAG